MFTKKLILILLFILAALGCGLKVNEKVKPTDVVELKSGSCLSDSNQTTKSFFKGTAETDEITEAMDCYANVIETFRDNVRGQSENAFAPEEVRLFIKNNFLKDSTFDFSQGLTDELMKVKALFVGGTRFLITHKELTALSDLLRDLKTDVAELNPLMPLVSGLDELPPDLVVTENTKYQNEFTQVQAAFRAKMARLARLFRYQHINYKINELFDLVIEVFKSNQTNPKTIEKMNSLRPLILKTAGVLIDDSLVLDSRNWKKLLNLFSDGYISYRRYDLLTNDQTKNLGLNDIAIEKIVSNIQPTITEIILQKKTQSISNNEIFELLKSLKIIFTEPFIDKPSINKWIQKILDLKNFDLLLNTLWSHVLNDPVQRLRDNQATNALDSVALNTLMNELGLLFRSQFHVHRLLNEASQSGSPLLKLNIKSYFQTIRSNADKKFDDKDLLVADESLQMFQSSAFHTFDENDFLKIFDPSNMSEATEFKLSDIEISNYARVGARLVIRSFSKNLDSVLLLKELSNADALEGWEIVRPIVNELDFVQSDNLTFMSSRFRESDLFVASSNGDGLAQFSEIHDLVLHIYSGQKRSNMIKSDLVNKFFPGTDPDLLKAKDTVDEKPLLDYYVVSNVGFQSLPQYMNLKTQQTSEELSQFSLSLLKAAGHVANSEMRVKFEDLNLFPHVTQYIEMLFYKFDINRDGILDKFEAVAAYPTYEKTVAEVLEKIGFAGIISQPERRKGVFLYLLQTGHGPETAAQVKEFTKFINDTRDLNTTDRWTINPNRLSLGNLFSFFSEKLNSAD
jgi:hypothetical protein